MKICYIHLCNKICIVEVLFNLSMYRFLIFAFFHTLFYLLGGEIITHANFLQPMLVSYSSCYFRSLEGDIRKVTNISTSGNQFALASILYYAVGQFIGVVFR